jgi:hypothetical protein
MRKVVMSNENLKTLCRQLVKIEINMVANTLSTYTTTGPNLLKSQLYSKRFNHDNIHER